jgi:hypothetical protein
MAWGIYSTSMNGLGQFINGLGHLQYIHEWLGTLTTHSWMAQNIYNAFMNGLGHLQHIHEYGLGH